MLYLYLNVGGVFFITRLTDRDFPLSGGLFYTYEQAHHTPAVTHCLYRETVVVECGENCGEKGGCLLVNPHE